MSSRFYGNSHKFLFGALANQARLDILRLLLEKEKCVKQLTRELGMSQTLVSHNLRRLVDARLVMVRRDGHFRYHMARKEIVLPLLGLIEKHAKNSGFNMRVNGKR